MWTNQRAALRIREFLFPPLLLEKYVSLTTFRKVFLYLGLWGEDVSRTIDLCGILTFWRSWIPFCSYAEVKFRVLQSLEKCRCSACSKQPADKSPSPSPLHPAACDKPPFTWHSQWWTFQYLQSWHVLVIYTSLYQRTFSWKRSQGFLHFVQHGGPVGVLQREGLSDFPRLSIYVTASIRLSGQLSTGCHRWQWVLRLKQINCKGEAGKKEEKSLIVAELMCFCLLWIVSSSPL